jgi:hypothetical protein
VFYLSHVKNDGPRREGARITAFGNEFVDCRAMLEMRMIIRLQQESVAGGSTSTAPRICFAPDVGERAGELLVVAQPASDRGRITFTFFKRPLARGGMGMWQHSGPRISIAVVRSSGDVTATGREREAGQHVGDGDADTGCRRM